MKIENRVKNLENLVYSLIKSINRDNMYSDADINGCITTDAIQQISINDNSDGVFDIANLGDENSTSVLELAEYIAELEERVTALEDQEG